MTELECEAERLPWRRVDSVVDRLPYYVLRPEPPLQFMDAFRSAQIAVIFLTLILIDRQTSEQETIFVSV